MATHRRSFCILVLVASMALVRDPSIGTAQANQSGVQTFDVVIVGSSPAGIMAAISAARRGHTAVILERKQHIGGLPANGLGKTDCFIPNATQGLFLEFRDRVKQCYVATYGADSSQVKACRNGLRFEPSVAEQVFQRMLAEQSKIEVLTERQFDADPDNVLLEHNRLVELRIQNRVTNTAEHYRGKIFIDATYEGDLAAAAGVPYRVGREGRDEFNEPTAGRLYQPWKGQVGPGSTGLPDNAIQAYNYRLCLTKNYADRVPISKPETYNRAEYISLIDDVKQNRRAGKVTNEVDPNGIGFVTNPVAIPNDKYDANNQHHAFLSTDLPEENWPWPTSGWEWRDQFAKRQRDYTLGLLWFAQHDEALPIEFRERCLEWGLAKSEFADNGHFPRDVYVREARRIEGEYRFTVHDALTKRGSADHASSITAWQYNADSHAVRKREPGHDHLDGINVFATKPCCVPYGVIVPKRVDGLLVPVAASASHVGFLVLRMEPCWMAMGQAAGTAASLAIEDNVAPRQISIDKLQQRLLSDKAVLIYFKDVGPGDSHFESLQFCALRGVLGNAPFKAELEKPVTAETAARWLGNARVPQPKDFVEGTTTRGELLAMIYEAMPN